MKRPQIGKFRSLVSIKARADVPNELGGVDDVYTETAKVWAQIEHVSAATYLGSIQIDEKFTHWITVRYLPDLTTGHVVDFGAQRFRISRIRNLDDRGRYLLIEAMEENRA